MVYLKIKVCPVCGPKYSCVKSQYVNEYCSNPIKHHGVRYALQDVEKG